jgi:Ion channel
MPHEQAPVGARSPDWRERWRDPILTALLVLLSLQIFVGEPLARNHLPEAPEFAVVWLLLVIAAVLVAARHWIAIAAILSSAVLALIANILRIGDPSKLTICVGSGSLLVFMAALSWVVREGVFGPGIVTRHRILGAIVLYLCIAVAFAALYEILLTLIPNSISGIESHGNYLVWGRGLVYYSLTTLTSTGYGDIVPTHPLARSLSNLEAVVGQLFPATLLTRIVTLEMQARRDSTS